MAVTTALVSQLAVGAVALYTLVTAAERAIDRLLALAQYYGVSEVLVGMTIVALGTSLPEISAHVAASVGILSGVLDYEIGSAVVLGGNMGSSTVQQLLLFGLFLVGYGQFDVSDELVRTSYVPMVLAFVGVLVVAVDGQISRLDGLLLLAGYLVYIAYSVTHRERATLVPEPPSTDPRRDALAAGVLLALVLLSASLLLPVVQAVVEHLALGGSMVGVVTIGVAAALPELTTVLDAVRRRTPNVAIGTLLGSNIVNPLVGIGLGGAISTYRVPRAVVVWDLPFKLLVALGVLGYLRYSGGSLTRREGGYLVVLYFVFVTTRLLLFPGQ
ncbi:MAG: sodium:calcium antiporter [Haloarculaceae archaeon]